MTENTNLPPLSPINATGVVSEVYPKMAKVLMDGELQVGETRKKLLCTYRRAQVIDQDRDKINDWRERSPVAPGDRVSVKVLGSKDGVIEEIFERKNSIQRRAPGKEGKILHTLAANIDHVVIVASYDDPRFTPGFIDRFLIAAEQAEIAPVLVINKMDLRKDESDKPWTLYESFGVKCFPVSSQNEIGLDVVKEFLSKKVSVFCGHSGVGKTSLLTRLFGSVFGKVGEISKATGKGKHTTTVSLLMEAADGTRFIDTPGIKEFGLHNINGEQLIQYFPELYAAQVAHEPYEHMLRYQNYLRIKSALEDEGR